MACLVSAVRGDGAVCLPPHLPAGGKTWQGSQVSIWEAHSPDRTPGENSGSVCLCTVGRHQEMDLALPAVHVGKADAALGAWL